MSFSPHGSAVHDEPKSFAAFRVANKIAGLSKVLGLRPDHTAARQGRAAAYASLGEHEKSVDDLGDVISRFPSQAGAYVNRARSFTTLYPLASACA